MLSWMLFVVLPCSTKQLFRKALRKIALQITYLSIGGHRHLSTWSVFFFFFFFLMVRFTIAWLDVDCGFEVIIQDLRGNTDRTKCMVPITSLDRLYRSRHKKIKKKRRGSCRIQSLGWNSYSELSQTAPGCQIGLRMYRGRGSSSLPVPRRTQQRIGHERSTVSY